MELGNAFFKSGSSQDSSGFIKFPGDNKLHPAVFMLASVVSEPEQPSVPKVKRSLILREQSTDYIYSDDLINWQVGYLPFTHNYGGVYYGDGKFLVLSDDGPVALSLDGINWTSYPFPFTTDKYQCVYGDGVWMVIGCTNSNIGATSPDGINWAIFTIPGNPTSWRALAYHDGRFVLADQMTNLALYSDDKGVTWNSVYGFPGSGCIGMCWGGDRFVMGSWKTNQAGYSFDGINWVSVTLPVTYEWHCVVYGNGYFLATHFGGETALIDGSDNYLRGSPDGLSWELLPLPRKGRRSTIIFTGEKFLTAAEPNFIETSDGNGVWDTVVIPEYAGNPSVFRGIACGEIL